MEFKKQFNLFDFSQKVNYKNEILAGLTVAMTMIPESLMFAILAGFSPLVGLYGAFIMGLFTAIFGGRPGLISGGAGATVVVLMALMASHGLEYVFGAIILAGVFQLIVGLLKLGKFIRLVPQPVMFGFVNGLAIIIFMAQMDQFKIGVGDAAAWLSGPTLYTMVGLVLFTIAIIIVFPKITKAVPASLVAIIVVFIVVYVLDIDTKQVIDIINEDTLDGEELKSLGGSLPSFSIPEIPVTWEDFKVILPYGLIMAAVGLTEGLLTLNLVDEITGTKGNSNRECLAQGGANILNGFFGGMGGCPMIAQTLVNLSAGSRARLSGIIAALTILIIILIGAPVIELVPIAALVGVMVMVAIGTFEWASFKALRRMPRSDIFVMLLVTFLTVFLHDLATAVLIGVIISALVFAWESAKRIRARKYIDESGVKHYEIYGPLFFGSVTTFNEKFDVTNDPAEIIIDFAESRVADMSAIEALNKLTERYLKAGKKLQLKHLSSDCITLLENADKVIDVNVIEDPTYRVVADKID
jgi:sulfate permease, SulP family